MIFTEKEICHILVIAFDFNILTISENHHHDMTIELKTSITLVQWRFLKKSLNIQIFKHEI